MSIGLFYPLNLIQGNTLDLPFSVADDNDEFLFDDYDLVGQVKSSGSSLPTASFTFTEDETDPDIMHAVIVDTSTLTSSTYLYEIRASHKTESNIFTVLYGSLDVSPSLITSPTNVFGR